MHGVRPPGLKGEEFVSYPYNNSMTAKLQRKTTLYCVFIPDFFLNDEFL